MIKDILNLNFSIKKGIDELFIHRLLFVLGKSFIAIFIPLYLHQVGFSAFTIIIFFLIYFSVSFVTSFPVAKLASTLGYRTSSMISIPILACFYWFMRNLEPGNLNEVYTLAILGGLGLNMYWIGIHAELSQDSHDGKEGAETGLFFSISSLAKIIAPVVGGFIISSLGFNLLFSIAVIILVLSFLPFLYSREHHKGMELSLEKLVDKKHLKDFILFCFRGAINLGILVVWPLYLALVIGGAVNVGTSGSLRAVGVVIFSLLIGAQIDKGNDGKVLVYGGTIFAISWVLMSVVASPVQAFIISLMNGLFSLALKVPLRSQTLKESIKEDVLEYYAFREVGFAFGRVIFLLLLVSSLSYLENETWFLVSFSLLAVSSFVCVVLGKQYVTQK